MFCREQVESKLTESLFVPLFYLPEITKKSVKNSLKKVDLKTECFIKIEN